MSDLEVVVTAASYRPFSVSGDFARKYAAVVAEGFQRGYLTTLGEDGSHGRVCKSTWAGEQAYGL